MTDPSDLLNLIGPGGSIFDEIGMTSMPSSSLPQSSTTDQYFNMDSFQNFPNQQSSTLQQKLHHLGGQSPSQEQFQPFSQKLSHFANPMLSGQNNAFQNAAPNKPQQQQFARMPGIRMQSPTQFSPQPSSSQGANWRAQTNMANSFGSFGMPQQPQQPPAEQGVPGNAMPQGYMSPQQTNMQRLQHFMTNKQNPMLSQSSNPFMSQVAENSSNLTDISNSTPKMNSQGKTVSPGQQFNPEMARQEQLSKLHHLVSGGMPSPTSDTATNSNSPITSFQASSNSSFTPSPDPFSQNKNLQPMYNNMQQQQQQQQSPIPNQTPMQPQDPFTQTPPPSTMAQDYLMRRPQQYADGSYQMRPNMPFQQQMMNQNPNPMSSQLKSAHLLYQLQRLQQQISQVRELPSPARDQPLQQLQQQFSRLYHLYLMDQQQQKKQQQAVAQMRFDQENLLKQQHQDKANRIVAEAIAKSALMNSGYNYQAEPQMKYFTQQFGPAVKGPMNYDMQQDKIAQRKAAEPIVLPPSIVNQLPKTVWSSSKPPATVLSKPVIKRERRDSSDHEPSPPNSPGSFYVEDNTPSSITRRSLRERKKKTYKDDFDYNLSDEEEGGSSKAAAAAAGGEVVKHESGEFNPGTIPVTDEIPVQEESLTVEKILTLRTETKEDGFAQEEFLVKYKNYSYLHSEWATAEKLMQLDKRVQMKIKRFFIKRSTMPFPDEIDDEPFNPDYVEVDRVLDVSTGVDQTGAPVSHYLVKWRSLAYDESTWEVEADVDNQSVNRFRSIQVAPPPHERQFRRRPHPSEWRKLDKSPMFKNSNTLREYQLEGLNWLTFCWYNGQNCILADEMGLGKTIQSLAFLIHVMQYGIRGPFLVIAPLSTIANWQREFESWGDTNVVVHHGSAASRHLIQQYEFYFRGPQGEPVIGLYKFNVLITTYEILIADNILLSSVPWRAVVIDEAHRLKNRNCKLLEGLNNLQMEHRILLTGTPLQNNVDELFSLLNFLEPAQFPSQGAFLMEFGNLRTEAQVERLQALLRPMMLRRMKEDVEKSLAPKEETIVEVELTTVQKKFYRAILERNFSFLNKGAVSTSNVPNLMNTMMELRKCCNHPFLINGAEEKIVGEYHANFTGENRETIHLTSLIEASGKLVLIDKLLPKLKAGGHKVLVFSQMVRCLDILEDYLICKKYLFERIDGRVRGNLRQAAIDRFSKPDSDRFVFLLCTRAGGLGINLTAADTVIIFDSDWNPQNDLQAQARCHRIGQDKSVKVYRLITRNSYEREMFDRASLKLGLDKAVLQSMNSKDGTANASGQNQQTLSKKEIEDLLKKGAYGAVMDDDEASSKFCEEDIDQILERRTQVITIDSVGQGSTFAKASFTATKKGDDIDIDDPDFWKKWAMKADIDVDELMNKDERIIDAPRQRKQTKRYGRGDDVDYELSDLDSDEEIPQAKRRAWTRVECFKVEKNLLVFGWQRWQDIIHAIRKRKLSDREVEAISRSILLFCVHAYRGDEKLRSFILELIKPLVSRERLPSEELDATYMPIQKAGGKKSKKSSKKGKSGTKNVNKSAIAVIEAVGDWKSVNPEILILDEGYKKHLRHHCNKILLRVRLLYIMRVEVIGMREPAVRNDCLSSDIDVNLPVTEGDPPIGWWNEDADKSLVIGVYKHGYERYNAIRADPCLIFLKKCGPPTSSDEATTGDAIDGEGLREEDENNDDPDYQLPQDRKNEDVESDDDVDFDMEGKESRPVVKEEVKVEKPPPVVEGSQTNPASTSNFLPWPSPSDLNTRLRRIVAGFQRILRKEELKRVAVEKENRRKEKVEEAVRQKELKKAEQAQKWSKREEVDFYRCVSTYGVHINPTTQEYDWSKFRQMARLDKKNDDRLSQYFKEFLAMCKRVCGRATDEEIILGQNVEAISEERASRCLRRVELMTMLRLDVLIHPELDERLKLAQVTPELPSWWRCEKHDKHLLIGVSRHGLTRTDLNILEDPDLSFYELKIEMDAQHIALAGNSTDLASGSPESSSRSVSGTPVALERKLDRTVMEKIEQLENQEGSLDAQTFPAVPKPTSVILPNPQTTASATTADDTARNFEGVPPATYKQNYINDMPSIPGSDALSSLVKQVSSLPSNPANRSGDFNPGTERRPDVPPPAFIDTDSQGSLLPDVNNLNPVINESLSIKIWWPKDRVVFHRVQQLCQLVVTGEWPAKPEKPERLVDQALPAASDVSMSPGGFPAYGDSEMDGGLGPEALIDPVSKAFKVKKHEGLKVTLKKNRKRKKKDGAGVIMDGMVDMDLPPETLVQQAPYQNDSSNPLKMDSSEMAGQLPTPKPRKKRQRRTDKPSKPPAEKKKRGRKSKMEKLMAQAAADAIHAGLSSQPGGDWARANSSGVFIPGEMMNGPQPHDSVLVNDVNMRRASLDNQLSEPSRVPQQTNVETAPPSTTVRTSVLKSTTSADGDIEVPQRRHSSTSPRPDNDPPPLLKSPSIPTNPAVISPTSKTPVRLSPFNNTEFPFGNNPFMNYANYPNAIGFPHRSTSPGFAAGFAGQAKTSAGSSPTSTSSSGSVGSGAQKTVYESRFPAKSPPATKLSESLGFNGFPSGIQTSTVASYTKLGLEADTEMRAFNSDSDNEPSDSLEASEEEGIPLSPMAS